MSNKITEKHSRVAEFIKFKQDPCSNLGFTTQELKQYLADTFPQHNGEEWIDKVAGKIWVEHPERPLPRHKIAEIIRSHAPDVSELPPITENWYWRMKDDYEKKITRLEGALSGFFKWIDNHPHFFGDEISEEFAEFLEPLGYMERTIWKVEDGDHEDLMPGDECWKFTKKFYDLLPPAPVHGGGV